MSLIHDKPKEECAEYDPFPLRVNLNRDKWFLTGLYSKTNPLCTPEKKKKEQLLIEGDRRRKVLRTKDRFTRGIMSAGSSCSLAKTDIQILP